jgi:hypothetical protein
VPAYELIGLSVLATLVPAGVVVVLKGRWTLLLAAVCLLFPLLWYGAFALANPSSWWARRFYSEAKMASARTYQERWSRSFAE